MASITIPIIQITTTLNTDPVHTSYNQCKLVYGAITAQPTHFGPNAGPWANWIETPNPTAYTLDLIVANSTIQVDFVLSTSLQNSYGFITPEIGASSGSQLTHSTVTPTARVSTLFTTTRISDTDTGAGFMNFQLALQKIVQDSAGPPVTYKAGNEQYLSPDPTVVNKTSTGTG